MANLAIIGWVSTFGVSSAHAQENSGLTVVSAPAISASAIFSQTNQMRAAAGLSTVTSNSKLTSSAQMKAQDMATKSYFAHANPEGQRLAYWLGRVGYQYKWAGENLAVGYDTATGTMNGWKNSPTHYANIVKPEYQELGVGVASGMYKGEAVTFVVQHFGATQNQVIPVTKEIEVEVKPVFEPAPATPAPAPVNVTPQRLTVVETKIPAMPALEILGVPAAQAATQEAPLAANSPITPSDLVMTLVALMWAFAGAVWFVEKEAEWALASKKQEKVSA